ncbi:MAG: DNA repair protein RadA, partial [Leptospiraceae bacterium]|nr:DNA repair protein RadA [Leptospiraceae bacterium]
MQKPKKEKVTYLCRECGETFAKWSGQCPACKTWNSLTENRFASVATYSSIRQISDAANETELTQSILNTQIGQLDRLLGGGIHPGAVILIGGEPGIGKSTLLLEILRNTPALYATGEESLKQVQARAKRLGLPDGKEIVQGNHLEPILEYAT